MAARKPVTPIIDSDMDSLYVLPLEIIPIETKALQRSRMIKNHHLRSVVEVFSERETGSGQIEVEALPKMFGWTPPEDEDDEDDGEPRKPHPDLVTLRQLSLLPTYDVFSLRILLRKMDIPVRENAALKLSPEKNRELGDYMTKFTRPLIMQVYGDSDVSIHDFDDIIRLFRDPDVRKAREKLKIMAQKLDIDVMEIPKFLEDYGDIFLSLSYYRQCLDRIQPLLDNFLDSMEALRNNWQLRNDQQLMQTCRMMESRLNELSAAVTGRFENFDRSTNEMWDNISAIRFQRVKELIQSYHTEIGGVLCALTVKLNAWVRQFPGEVDSSPVRRAEFIMTQMRQGFDRIQKMSNSTPMLSQL
ncbi:hypothetical protein C882_3028 [Caenispirillum salinarum AK4]|uniref:Uncharacterized protein n=1 Tax=Caenispirillum salinarum AK4 TaxID=1238182 RepID=K9H4F0_9PROT|nr:hypothetical protein [Caenispirillum salinarum]EKV31964.1 hypothetical protein C882_3028 [Caenispirillum salinarum AK4]